MSWHRVIVGCDRVLVDSERLSNRALDRIELPIYVPPTSERNLMACLPPGAAYIHHIREAEVDAMALILVVDDERDLVSTLEYNLQREGFETRAAGTGELAIALAKQKPRPDLVILDLMLPDIPGTEVCRRLRADERTGDLPIVMLTAKGEEVDRIVGFEIGADDYVVKPFSVRELILRIRAVLRRREHASGAAAPTCFGRLRVDEEAHRAWVDGDEVTLTALEFKLLTTLLSRRGRVQSRDRLLSDVWGIDANVTTRTVDTHVKRLRAKLKAAADYVETLRGVGYRFRSGPEGDDA